MTNWGGGILIKRLYDFVLKFGLGKNRGCLPAETNGKEEVPHGRNW